MVAGKIRTEKRQHPASRQPIVPPEPGQKIMEAPIPVTITTPEGKVFEIADAPLNLARATALASERTLRKFWDSPHEDEMSLILIDV